MPLLDVSEILIDPDFCETVTVKRTAQTVSVNGFAQQSVTTFDITAVVTQGTMNPMSRTPEYEMAHETITVHSQTRLIDPIVGSQPDVVLWKGQNFVVTKSSDWSTYGAGFTAAECELQDPLGQS